VVTAIVLVTTEGERVQEAAQAMLAVEGVTEPTPLQAHTTSS